MAKNYLGPGAKISVPPNTITTAVKSGDVYVLNDLVGVLLHDGAANAENVLQVEGVFLMPKATGASTGGAQGKKAYVVDDAGTWKATADATGAVAAGNFEQTAADGDTTAQIKLAGTSAVA